MTPDAFGGFALTAGGFGVIVFVLLRIYLKSEASRETLLDRYERDLVAKDDRIDRLEAEVITLSVALDLCRRELAANTAEVGKLTAELVELRRQAG